MSRYLVRKKNYRILGPMTLDELKGALAALEVSLADEVAASLKPWVFLDDVETLKACYPEVVEIFRTIGDFPSISENINASDSFTRQDLSKVSRGFSGSGRKRLAWLALTVVVVGVAFFLGGPALDSLQISKKVAPPPQVIKSQNGATLYKEIFIRYGNDWRSAADFVLKNQSEILTALANEPAYGNKLLPYIRLQAFVAGQGYYEGVDSKLLYGQNDSTTCRVSEFKKVWKASEGSWKNLSKPESWMKILLTHKSWLQTRWAEGWILPKTFEGACLFLAEDAFLSLYGTEPLSSEGEAVRRRLARLTAVQLGEGLPTSVKSNHPFDILSCLEDSKIEKEIGECLKRNKDREWRTVFQSAANVNRIHRGELPTEDLGKYFPFTQLDLSPEQAIASGIKAGKPVAEAIRIAQDQFPQFVKD